MSFSFQFYLIKKIEAFSISLLFMIILVAKLFSVKTLKLSWCDWHRCRELAVSLSFTLLSPANSKLFHRNRKLPSSVFLLIKLSHPLTMKNSFLFRKFISQLRCGSEQDIYQTRDLRIAKPFAGNFPPIIKCRENSPLAWLFMQIQSLSDASPVTAPDAFYI